MFGVTSFKYVFGDIFGGLIKFKITKTLNSQTLLSQTQLLE
jgi:hypothetical protein